MLPTVVAAKVTLVVTIILIDNQAYSVAGDYRDTYTHTHTQTYT